MCSVTMLNISLYLMSRAERASVRRASASSGISLEPPIRRQVKNVP
jgi:hypothetical protein